MIRTAAAGGLRPMPRAIDRAAEAGAVEAAAASGGTELDHRRR
jgi:hypothetical protein